MPIRRRDFVKYCSLAGIGLAAPVSLSFEAQAQDEPPPYEGPYYVVFNAAGGWDTSYMMDPKGVNEINRLYKDGDIVTHGNHKFAPIAKHIAGGMSNEDFFAKYGGEIMTFNGLDYSVNNHSPGARYMATGKLDSVEYPTFAALAAACQGPTCPLAFLTFGNYSATGNLTAMSRVSYVQSLKRIAIADGLDGSAKSPYHAPFALDRIEQTLAAQKAASDGQPRLPRLERADNMLYAAQANSKALERVLPFIPSTLAKDKLGQQADVALAAFKGGVCVSANLTLGTFDSHDTNDPAQMKMIPELLAGIDYLLRRADELGIREKLVVVMQSEMGRTPRYNKGNGKDHWSIGSMMFLGRGIKGNRVIGATDEKQMALPFNPKTLAVDSEKGTRIRPEHVHTALRELAGIADHPYAKKFPFVIKDDERLENFWG